MYLKIGFDGGYGNTKVVTSRGERLEIPSVVGGGFQRKYADVFGHQSSLSTDNIHVKLDGRNYFVGELALRESKTPSTAFEINKINHPNNRVIIAATTAYLMHQEIEDIIIVASLPLMEFATQKKELKDYLTDFSADVIIYNGTQEISRKVQFAHAAVFPQAAAALYYLAKQERYASLINTDKSVVAIADIGMKTLDVVVLEIGDKIDIMESMSFGFHTGVSLIHDYLGRVVQEKTGINLSIPELDVILRQSGKWCNYDFSEAIAEGKAELMRMVNDEINEKWPERLKLRINKVFLIGGGGQYLFEEFKNSHALKFIQDDIELPPNPRMANAEGCLEVANKIESIVLSR